MVNAQGFATQTFANDTSDNFSTSREFQAIRSSLLSQATYDNEYQWKFIFELPKSEKESAVAAHEKIAYAAPDKLQVTISEENDLAALQVAGYSLNELFRNKTGITYEIIVNPAQREEIKKALRNFQ
jgi:hypothetical protein